VVKGGTAGAADGRGMFSVYAWRNDTITFSCIGYRHFSMTVLIRCGKGSIPQVYYLTTDTTLIPAVVVIPRSATSG
jgi:hypothetical protein